MSVEIELQAINEVFKKFVKGNTHMDWTIVDSNIEFDGDVYDLFVEVEFAPYCYTHTVEENKTMYEELVEKDLDKIISADNDELKVLVVNLNKKADYRAQKASLDILENSYLKGSFDYLYSMWRSEQSNTEITDDVVVNIVSIHNESDYFIYEDLALIRAGLDNRISNSPDYVSPYNEDDINWSAFDDNEDDI